MTKRPLIGAAIAALLALAATVITSTDASAAPIPGHWYTVKTWGTNYCLDADVSSGGLYGGDRVQLYTCNGWNNQLWFWDGSYLHSGDGTGGNDWCLAVNESGGAQLADGHGAVVYRCAAETNFRFSLNSDGSIQNHWNGKCLDANASAIGDRDSIAYWGCVSGKPNQRWYFTLES